MNNKWFLIALAVALPACAESGACGGARPVSVVPADHVLLEPQSSALKEVPPDTFDVLFETTQGDVLVRIYREWAPMGAYRFYNLVRSGFYDGSRFFRVLDGFVAQFGASGRPPLDSIWGAQPIPDDPRRVENRTGTLVYAKQGTNSRTTQLFFNYRDNEALDAEGFAPIGSVIEGRSALYLLYGGYGETAPQGTGPAYACILSHGNRYLEKKYPRLDYIRRARVVGS